MRLSILTLFCASSLFLSAQTSLPVASFLFNGATNDASAYMNHGTAMGGISYTKDRFGNECGAIELNGTDTYVEVPASKSINGITTNFTIATWFLSKLGPNDFQWFTIACKGDDQVESPNSPQWRLQGTSKTVSINTDFTEFLSQPVQAGKWYHYAVSWDGITVHTYLNGVETGQFTYSGALVPNSAPLYIGRDIPGNEEYFKGAIDELYIFDTFLTDLEIADLYNDDSERISPKPCSQDSSTRVPSKPSIDSTIGTAPKVSFINPLQHHVKITDRQFTALATIEGVNSDKDIIVTVNGKDQKTINFNGNQVSLKLNDSILVHTITIEATNSFGSATDFAVVEFTTEIKPPQIQLTESTHITEVSKQEYELSCTVLYAKSQDIQVLHNGENRTLDFDNNSMTLSSSIKLKPGINLIQLNASNNDGRDTKFIQLNYVEPIIQHDLGIVDTVDHIRIPVGEITLSCFDHNKIDGDVVSIFLNDELLFDNLKLRPQSEKKAVKKLNLVKGKKYILVCKAINEGTIATNTLSVSIEDDKGFRKVFKLQSKKGTSEAFSFMYN